MKKYIIGVTPRPNQTETNTFIRVNRNYIDQLTSRDLVPIILTPGSDLNQVLPLCDGFLVIGGDDFNPTMYGENNDEGLSKEIDDERRIEINILLDAEVNKVRISVFNTGDNIDENEMQRIWGRFYKIDSSRNREHGGSGIGLAFVKAIMSNYKNEYGCVNKDEGVEFFFDLDME